MSELLNITKNKDIWGLITTELVQSIHRKILKKILNVKSSTINSAIYGELLRSPLHINMKVRKIKYFVKLLFREILELYNAKCSDRNELSNNPNFWTFK